MEEELDQCLTLPSMEDNTSEMELDADGITLRLNPDLSLRFYVKDDTRRVDIRTLDKTIPLIERQWDRLRELQTTMDLCFTLLRDGPSCIFLE